MKAILAFLLTLSIAIDGFGQTVNLVPGMNKTGIKYIKGSNTTAPCIIWTPDDWNQNSSQKYPLIIAYHGAEAAITVTGITGNQDTSVLLGNGILVDLNKGQKAQTFFGGQLVKFIVVAPQASSYSPDTTWFNPNFNDLTKRLLVGIGGVVKIDSTRIYITGYSAGGKPSIGNTCLSTSDSLYSKLVAASVIMSPATQDVTFPKLYLAAKRNINFLGFVGGADPSYIPQLQRVQDTIQKYNKTLFPIADVIAGNGHCCFDQYWDTAYAVPGFGKNIYQWLLQWQLGHSHTPPLINAGTNQTILLPTTSVTLNGSVTPGDSKILSLSWAQLSGPNNAVFTSPGSPVTTVTNLIRGTYIFQLSATDSFDLTGYSATQVIVQQPLPPTVNAGGNLSIVQPTTTLTLNGAATPGTGGRVFSTIWTQRSGPNSAVMANPASLSTQVTGLIAGTYVFRLTATDSVGNSGLDSAVVTVYTPSGNAVNVRLYAGSIPFTNSLWNNWNVGTGAITNKASSTFKFSDGTSSPFIATLSYQDNLADNGANYTTGATMCPDSALRFCSYSTSPRTLTISGLDNTAKYSFEFYASRSRTDGQKTTFTIGSQAVTVLTDNNATSAAKFTGISPSAGKITVNITRVSTYNYLNSFKIIVNIVNTGPTLTVGNNQTITLPVNSVTLSGSIVAGNSRITSVTWSQVSGPSIATMSTPLNSSTQVTGLIQGVYIFKLTATDSTGLSASANTQITVLPAPVPPASNAGTNQTISLPLNTATLTGSATAGSSKIVSILWSLVSGPGSGSIISPGQLNTQIINLIQGIYIYKLLVTDSAGLSSNSTVQITVLPAVYPPTVNAGSNQTITLPQNSIFIDGTDNAGSSKIVSTLWTQISGPSLDDILLPNSLMTQVTNLVAGTYTFQLQATDSMGLSSIATIQVVVLPPVPPTVNAGNNISLTYPSNSVKINASVVQGSSPVLSILWTEVSGPGQAVIEMPDSAGTLISNLLQGSYIFQIAIVDSLGLTAMSTLEVDILPAIGPSVNAGVNQSITFPISTVILSGNTTTGSSPIISTSWNQIDGPTSVNFSDPGSPMTSVTNLIQGTYIFQLFAIDSLGLSAVSTVQITVNPPLSPKVNAGPDQTIIFPQNASLNGKDTIGSSPIISTSWNQISGPTSASFSDPGSLITSITNLIQGTYIFQLYALDSLGLSAVSTVQITITPPLSPIANAGPDQTIIFPHNTLLSGKDTAGSSPVLSIKWSQNAGPSTVVFADSSKLTTLVTNLIPGNYIFQLTIVDSLGLTSSSIINILVQPAVLPTVDAGVNQTIALPTNSVSVTGTVVGGSSPVVNSIWTETGGPGTAIINNPLSPNTIISSLVQGTYIFRLTVVDSLGNSVYDSAVITVNQAPPSVINVRIYGGVTPFKNSQWNNWNVGSGVQNNMNSGLLNYSDGSVSQIKTVLSYQDNIADNGTGYTTGATMCPDTAIRFVSYSTSNRTITISGLNNSKKYNVSLYASRSRTDGQKTTFTSGSQTVTVSTDNNSTSAAKLVNLVPTSGNIVVSLSRGSTYNYINGFSITDASAGGTSGLGSSPDNFAFAQSTPEIDSFNLKIYPNPTSDHLIVSTGNGDLFDIQLININGQIIRNFKGNIGQKDINMIGLPSGVYVIVVNDERTNQIFRKKILKY